MKQHLTTPSDLKIEAKPLALNMHTISNPVKYLPAHYPIIGIKPTIFMMIAALSASVLLSGCATDHTPADAYGHFEATEIVVSPEVAGTLIWSDFHEGAMVEAGQILAQSDTTSIHLQRQQLEAQIRASESRLSGIQAQQAIIREQERIARREQERLSRLTPDQSVTGKQLDDIDGQIRVLQRQIEQLSAQMLSVRAEADVLRAQRAILQDQLRRATIHAPETGTILARYAENGELLQPGRPLFRLADLRTMYLKAWVSGDQLAQIKLDQSVRVRIDRGSDDYTNLTGTISWISARAEFTPRNIQTKSDRVNQVYAIRVRVPNDGSLKIGMPGEVVFTP